VHSSAAMKIIQAVVVVQGRMFAASPHATRRRDGGRADRRSCSNPSYVVERNDGKTGSCQAGSRRALRARAGSRRGRRGRPVLQAPVLGAADSKRRNCAGIRGVLLEVLQASMSASAALGTWTGGWTGSTSWPS
jgi:hypothetical protein